MNVRIILAPALVLTPVLAMAVAAVHAQEPAAPPATPSEQEPIVMHAQGRFEVTLAPQEPDSDVVRAAGLTRMSLDKRYQGALDGISRGEMLADGDGSQRDGAYVAMERFAGTLDGREGGFALVHHGLMRDRTPERWTVTVVPGSGTGALAGIEGEMRIRIEDGGHFYELDYTLPARAGTE